MSATYQCEFARFLFPLSISLMKCETTTNPHLYSANLGDQRVLGGVYYGNELRFAVVQDIDN